MLQFEKTGVRSNKKDLWIKINTKKEGAHVDVVYDTIVCSHYRNQSL